MKTNCSNTARLQTLFQNLADENRLKIVFFIGTGERSVSEIAGHLAVSQPLVSHHLKALRESGIVNAERSGPFVFYRLTRPELPRMLGSFAELYNDEHTSNKEK